jgi:RHS repeat-associated protein
LQVTTDTGGGKTTLTYDSAGNVSTIQDALGRVTTAVYDAKNRLTALTDAAGGTTTMAYNVLDEVTDQYDALGRESRFTYDARGQQTTAVDAYGNPVQQTATLVFDALGRLTQYTDPLNHTTTMTYDAMGRLRTRTSPVGGVETFTYDNAGQRTAYTDQLNHTTTYTYNSRGWQTTMKDALNQVTTATYDTEGNLTSVTNPRGYTTTYAYDALNRLLQSTNALGGLATVVYDAVGNVSARVDELGSRTTYSYDALDRLETRQDALTHVTTLVYDKVGNVVKVLDALGNATTLTYDALNRRTGVQDPGGGLATTVYDAVGNVVNTIDPLGNKATVTYDALNRATAQQDARGGITTVVYDAVGNVVNVIDAVGNRTTFAYDAANRMTQRTDPLGKSGTYAYDLADRLTSETDRLGRRQDFSYDNANRLTGAVWKSSGGSTVNTLTYTYDADGNLLTAADQYGTYTFTYDALDRATSQRDVWGMALTFSYDAAGNRTRVNDSLGGVLTSVYDAVGNLTSRQFGGAGQTPLRIDLTYTSRNQIAGETRYTDLAGTTVVGMSSFTYDNAGRLSNLQHKNASNTVLANYTYTYDLASRVQTTTTNGATVTYTYDAVNELTGDGTNSYSYDLNGNRTMTGYTTGAGNRLTSDGTWTYTYDDEGNLIKKSKGASAETWKYTYDNRNQLTHIEQRSADDNSTPLWKADYKYDVFGNRIEQSPGPGVGPPVVVRFAYDGPNVWADLNDSTQLTTRRLYLDGVDQVFARVSSGGAAAWYLTDRLGSVRDVTNAAGTVQDHIDFSAFGGVVTETNSSIGDRYKWTGREYDGTSGLQYNRARYYDCAVGRWTTQDPLGLPAGDANLYRYVGNGPTNMVDPSGLTGIIQDTYTVLYTMYRAACDPMGDADNLHESIGNRSSIEAKLAYAYAEWIIGPSGPYSQNNTNLSAGIGDGVTFGASYLIRWALYGDEDMVEYHSGTYAVGHGIGNLMALAIYSSLLPNCFPPDTLVSTETGLRPIAEIKPGERVWAYDFQEGQWRLCPIECRHDAVYEGPLVTLDVGGSKVTATAYHPFWVIEGQGLDSRPALRHVDISDDRGGSLPGRWVNSHDLRTGDLVLLRSGNPATICSVWQHDERTPVCNLTVRGLHTFAVGVCGLPVHNSSGSGLTWEEWNEQVNKLKEDIAALEEKIASILEDEYGYGRHRVDGSEKYLTQLLKQIGQLLTQEPTK